MPFQIIRNDITNIRADAIVNSANPEPVYSRGTDGAIYQKAGAESLLAERRKIGRIEVGEAAVTPAFGMDARFIIHTVGPVWQGGGKGEAEDVRRCYRNSLCLAKEHGCESIAFPLLSTGTYGFPKGEALRIALSEISNFLSKEEMLVYLAVFDGESFELSGKLFEGIDSYIDENYVRDRLEEEYPVSSVYGEPDSEENSAWRGNPVPLRPYVPKDSGKKPFLNSPRELVAPMAAAMPEESFQKQRSFKNVRKEPAPPAAALMVPDKELSEKEKKKGKLQSLFSGKKGKKAERSLEDVMAQLGETFQERLFGLIDEKGLTDVEVYKKANLDRKLFSKIRCNADYRPKKTTAIALAVALELNLDETKDLLSRAEMALSPSSKFDLIITYFIEQEVYDIYTINLALFQHEQPMLG